ncbi:MAG: hypothetical protein M3162_03135 [Thermoproteota archaeon]|nr:hypothetical protein [Thermoproteota archaeon]
MARCHFFCIDVVGASKEIDEQKDNLNTLLKFINNFLGKSKIDSKKVTTFTGDGVFIIFEDNSLLPLKLAISLHQEFRNPKFNNFRFKIGIAYGDASIIEEAEHINGLPYWGKAPTVAKRLCDLCDSYHILINDEAEDQFRELITHEPGILSNQEYEDVFQPIGIYYLKHNQKLEVFNFYLNDGKQVIGNLVLPLDKRGIIDRLPVDEKLARPLDYFFQKEAYKLVSRIDNEEGVILFIDSAKRLYEALFEESTEYYGINKTIPSEFFEYNQQFIIRHAELLRSTNGRKEKKEGIRIMLMTKEDIRRDWYCNNTRNASTNFIRFHMDHNIKLLQINPYLVQETIIPSLVSKHNSFYLQSSHIGIWKNRYVILFGKLDLRNSSPSRLGIGKFWIFSANNQVYKYCEEFFYELLDFKKYEINELTLDGLSRPKFTRWQGEGIPKHVE